MFGVERTPRRDREEKESGCPTVIDDLDDKGAVFNDGKIRVGRVVDVCGDNGDACHDEEDDCRCRDDGDGRPFLPVGEEEHDCRNHNKETLLSLFSVWGGLEAGQAGPWTKKGETERGVDMEIEPARWTR